MPKSRQSFQTSPFAEASRRSPSPRHTARPLDIVSRKARLSATASDDVVASAPASDDNSKAKLSPRCIENSSSLCSSFSSSRSTSEGAALGVTASGRASASGVAGAEPAAAETVVVDILELKAEWLCEFSRKRWAAGATGRAWAIGSGKLAVWDRKHTTTTTPRTQKYIFSACALTIVVLLSRNSPMPALRL